MNREAFQTFSRDRLHVTVGAYGLCKGGNGKTWFEWGHPDQLSAKEMIRCPYAGGKNCHVWLEDAHGNVFDVLPLYIRDTVAALHRKTIDTSRFFCDALILGVSKMDLEEAGLVYIPAPREEQKKVVRHTIENMRFQTVE
jgi:hypothetical protein